MVALHSAALTNTPAMEDIYQAVATLLEGQEALKLKAEACQFEITLVSDPDIWEPLKYLYDMGFIEGGGDPESGIDL